MHGAHGRKLSEQEYSEKIIDLYSSTLSEEEIKEREINLIIDKRLGVEFPKDRREKIQKLQKNINKHKFLFLMKSFFTSRKKLEKNSSKLANSIISEYSKLLTNKEIKEFFED